MSTSDDQAPRHFKPGDKFYVIVPRGPLPAEALIEVKLYGGRGGHRQTIIATGSEPFEADSVRVSGRIPNNAASGAYKIMSAQMKWKPGSPPHWRDESIPLDEFGIEGTVIVDEPDEPLDRPQPPLPGPRRAPGL